MVSRSLLLDTQPLGRALAQLEECLALQGDVPRLARPMRAAAIQAFEVAYELSSHMLRRYFQLTGHGPDTDLNSFSELIRSSREIGLLSSDVVTWRGFQAARNTSCLAYDDEKAAEIFARIPAFLADAKYLLGRLSA